MQEPPSSAKSYWRDLWTYVEKLVAISAWDIKYAEVKLFMKTRVEKFIYSTKFILKIHINLPP